MKRKLVVLPTPFSPFNVKLGCDPEFFIETKGKVDGSEKIIPEQGLTCGSAVNYGKQNIIKRDGVQCEINPEPQFCRAYLHNEIQACFKTLRKQLGKYKVSNKQVIKMDRSILNSLSAEARRFGCMPSKNAYTEDTNKITVSASRYLFRSAGGHIHVGQNDGYTHKFNDIFKQDINEIIKLFDIVVGCTGTLLDRDIWAKERRKVYGRAGDYRLPKHGFEYRTLSNFWLKDYMYMSLMFGLARTACEFVVNGVAKKIISLVDDLDIERIINENDINGAIEVWNLMKHVYAQLPHSDHYPLSGMTVDRFDKFIYRVYKPEGAYDLVDYWCKRPEGHAGGFVNNLCKVIK